LFRGTAVSEQVPDTITKIGLFSEKSFDRSVISGILTVVPLLYFLQNALQMASVTY